MLPRHSEYRRKSEMIGPPYLSMQPPVQDNGVYGCGESDVMFIFGMLLTKDESVVEENPLRPHLLP